MSSIAEVKLWGRTIGAVYLADDVTVASFEYETGFSQSGIEIAPLTMPLSRQVYSFPELEKKTFNGLPGLLADSLPDKFGNALIDAWLSSQGRLAKSFNPVERLRYMGKRGMGALEYAEVIGPENKLSKQLHIDKLVELASLILKDREKLQVSFSASQGHNAPGEILRVGTSAGGARAKAVIAWNPQTNEVRSGQVDVEQGFEHWLMKFDGVSGNRDKELDDPQGFGLIEYTYYQMARACGINMSECRLFTENSRQHFMTRRFDRNSAGEKIHMQSLCAMAHYDFNAAGAYSYEQAFQTIRRLRLPMQSIEEQFRRMAFNIIARNQDDHVKNIAFLMDKKGRWSLSPAFDMTYSYNPSGAWTASHQMSLNNKREGFILDDFKACAKVASMKRGRATTIVKEVHAVVSQWNNYAENNNVSSTLRDQIKQTLRLSII